MAHIAIPDSVCRPPVCLSRIPNVPSADYSAGQFVVKFVTSKQRTGGGFKLDFRQNPCSSQQLP